MDEIAIDIKNLSKVYKLYEKPIDRLKETLSFTGKSYHKDFYALNNINLQIKKGETVGIIGKNGAGKSTLLKIITGVLSPTSGTVKINGRISSLLELGAGFNPEYSGIENIYLNGTIMGMTREEVDERMQDILDFADIGDFVYQPVKTYSSGMYVRLAFSVAINVNPDILIVDEALAVGDARFQARCYKKLEALKEKGTTILFVSHDIATVKSICSKAILINDGKVIEEGDPKDVCVGYFKLIFPENGSEKNISAADNNILKDDNELCIVPDVNAKNSFGIGGVTIKEIKIEGANLHNVCGGEHVSVKITFVCDYDLVMRISAEEGTKNNFISGISISNVKGDYLFGMTTYDKGILLPVIEEKKYSIEYNFVFPYLASGDYLFNTAIALGTQESHVQLKWYDGLEVIKVASSKKYMYGQFYNEYEAKGNYI